MGSLGDLFPKSHKEEFLIRKLRPGSVFKCKVFDTQPPKIKRFIVIGISEDSLILGTVYINTEINPNVFPTTILKNLHLPLDVIGREEILEHDSFVDCSEIFEKNIETIRQILDDNPEVCLGEVSTQDFKDICTKLKSAHTISPKDKRRF